jgi:D-glycero-D-manno-heptose 1,7-bisphosphate phosphatase
MSKVSHSAYVLFDRDGTLIKFEHYLIDPEKVVLAEGVVQGIHLLQKNGFVFGMITNQSVIGRGLATVEMVTKVNERVISLLSEQDIEFQFVLYCPHTPEDFCKCRKPEPGLGKIAIQEHGLDPKRSYMIGDRSSDVRFGHAIGCKSVQIIGKTSDVSDANYFANNILEAAQWIKSEIERG